MANPISDFMTNWLNTTYEYLKETGGPTYPKTKVGIGAIPTGPYSTVEDYPIDYGYVPVPPAPPPPPFNRDATGIPATANSQFDADAEEAKQNPPPTIFSKNFGLLYGNMMNACIDDQRHRHNNPNALNACRGLAERGDSSDLSLTTHQKGLLGIKTVLLDEDDKPDDIRLSENEDSLTAQIAAGAKGGYKFMKNFILQPDEGGKGNVTPLENPEGANFQNIGKKISGLVPGLPDIPGMAGKNADLIIMVGGGAVLLVLLILVFK